MVVKSKSSQKKPTSVKHKKATNMKQKKPTSMKAMKAMKPMKVKTTSTKRQLQLLSNQQRSVEYRLDTMSLAFKHFADLTAKGYANISAGLARTSEAHVASINGLCDTLQSVNARPRTMPTDVD